MGYTVKMTAIRPVALISVILLVGGALGTAVAATNDTRPRHPAIGVTWPKLSSELAQVLHAERARGRGLSVARAKGLSVVAGRVRVVVEVRTSPGVVRSAVLGAGGKIEASHANLVQVLVAPSALDRLSRMPAVRYVRAPHRLVFGGGPIFAG